MPKYNKGYETKHRIIKAAKQLFYENGLDQTKIIDICRLAGIKNSNFRYYFDSKTDLANEISADLLVKTYHHIHLHHENSSKLDSFQQNAISGMLHYSIIFSDEKNIRYYYQVLRQKSVYDYANKNVERIYKQFIKDFQLEIPLKDLPYFKAADLGMRRQLSIEYIEESYPITPFDLSEKISTFTGRIFAIHPALVSDRIAYAREFATNTDFSNISYLKDL
ncbi:MAG TPA: hypothetical protein DHN33_11870 [Eubacteriaceae bacterium]|nr:hypothetical protein [Eubacteriaceae bacterium]